MGKVAIIGLDGLSWDILLPYVGFLPNLRRLLSSSIVGSLNCKPPLTPPSWTSIFTGVSPEKHGILGFAKYYRRDSKLRWRFYNAADVAVPRISEILAFHGLSSVLINHILSYPLSAWYRKNHVILYDVLSPRPFIYPKSLRRYLKYFRYPGDKLSLKAGRSSILNTWSKLIELRIEGTIKLVEDVSPDLLVEVISETDSAMHKVPPIASGKFVDDYLEILEPIDELINYATRHFNTVVLVSDHGLRVIPKSINLQLMLKTTGDRGEVNVSSFKGVVISLILGSRISGWISYSLLSSMKTYDFFYRIRSLLRKNVEGDAHQRSESSGVYFDPVDASDAMILYCESQKKRDYLYRLAIDVFGNLLDEAKKIDITGISALMIVPKRGYYLNVDGIYRDYGAKIINFPSARHTPLGVFALWSKKHNRPKSKYIGIVNNVDVVPTVLSDLGIPIPSYIDGNCIISKKLNHRLPKEVGDF